MPQRLAVRAQTAALVAAALGMVAAAPCQAEPAAASSTGPADSTHAAELAEAERLTAEVERLAGDGHTAEAVPLARRALALREAALGPEHLAVATSLNNLAYLLKAGGDLAAAEPLYRRALAIREKALGAEHVDLAATLNNLAGVMRARGDYAAAEQAYLRALGILTKALGADHASVAVVLGNYAAMQRERGDLPSAVALFRQLLSNRLKALAPSDPEVLDVAMALAHVHMELGEWDKAEPLLREVLAQREKALSPDHSDVLDVVCDLASLLQDAGKLAEAEPFYRRALAGLQTLLGRDHGTIAALLNNYALLLKDLGRHAEAEGMYRRALAIREKQYGPDHVQVAITLRNLAILLHAQGNLAAAEPPLRRALAIAILHNGPEHPSVAQALASLASLLHDKGDLAGAEALYRQVLAMREKLLGPKHLEVADSLNDLASLLQDRRQLADAEALYRRALAVREGALGARDGRVAQSLNNLALLLKIKGDLAGAEPLYRRALAIWEGLRGSGHPDNAVALNNLANLLQAQGNLSEAGTLHRRALAIRERVLGPQHPLVAASLHNLATLLEAQGDARASSPLRLRALGIEERQLASLLLVGSEQQKLAYSATLMGSTHASVSLAIANPKVPLAVRAGLTAVLQRKGRVLDAVVQGLTALRQHASPSEQRQLTELLAAKAALAARYGRGPSLGKPEAFRSEIDDLQRNVEELERAVAAGSGELSAALRAVELGPVQAALPPGAILVEFLRFQPFDAKTRVADDRWGSPRYAAFVLAHQGDPTVLDLGPAEAIEAATENARKALAANLDTAPEALRRLDALVLAPLRPSLTRAQLVLISPDAALHTIPFDALLDEGGHYAVERMALHDLNSGRDLLRLGRAGRAQQPPLFVADPDFDAAGESQATTTTSAQSAGGVAALRWSRLAGTAAEVEAIAPLLPGARVLLRAQATELAVKSSQAPRILHIATHGFFLEDAPSGGQAGSRGAELIGDDFAESSGQVAARRPAQLGGNPLLRSGLVLAGIGAGARDANDGALTALEVTALDLWGTELVVLSACSTGRGEVHNGEGVFGLRRAFAMAGAQSLVMSLWDVDDDATRELMVSFYKNLQGGSSRSAALRAAKRSMLANPKWAHPNYWAAFIGSGAWGVLSAQGQQNKTQ